MWRVVEAATGGESGAKSALNELAGDSNTIIMALIGLIATSIAALVFVIRNNSIAKQAAGVVEDVNAAVNNVGPGQHKLYDMIARIRDDVAELKEDQKQFDSHGWETLPADLNTAVALTTTIRDLQNHKTNVNEKLDTIITELREHVEWEMDAKYGKHGST